MKKSFYAVFMLAFVCVLSFSEISALASYSKGASALANAYVRANPVFAYYYGSLESYVADNREHFVENGDAIKCAEKLASALLNQSIQSYDPNALRQQQEVNARLGAIGISPGSPQITASQALFTMARQFDRFVRVLPPAANGNYQPLRTPSNQEEQLEMFVGQLLTMMLQDPDVSMIFRQMEPDIKQLAELQYQQIVNMAKTLE